MVPSVYYVVHEQWPHADVACFLSLTDAQEYMQRLVLPIIRVVRN